MINTELFKKCLLQGPTTEIVEKDGYFIEYFDKFYICKSDDSTDIIEGKYLSEYPKDWRTFDFGEAHNIGGRCNFMWLTDDGRSVSTHFNNVSHFTILNWTIYNMIKSDSSIKKDIIKEYWDPDEIQTLDHHDPIMVAPDLDGKELRDNDNRLANYMKKIMIETSTIRLSGPYRGETFGGSGSGYGHAHKLLESADFTIESFNDLTKKQIKFIKLVINIFHLTPKEVFIYDYTENQTMKRDIF